jgi:hypothetical protein
MIPTDPINNLDPTGLFTVCANDLLGTGADGPLKSCGNWGPQFGWGWYQAGTVAEWDDEHPRWAKPPSKPPPPPDCMLKVEIRKTDKVPGATHASVVVTDASGATFTMEGFPDYAYLLFGNLAVQNTAGDIKNTQWGPTLTSSMIPDLCDRIGAIETAEIYYSTHEVRYGSATSNTLAHWLLQNGKRRSVFFEAAREPWMGCFSLRAFVVIYGHQANSNDCRGSSYGCRRLASVQPGDCLQIVATHHPTGGSFAFGPLRFAP